jgi:hypothetical protein
MDEENRDRTDERHEAAADIGHDPAAPHDRASIGAAAAGPVVRKCSWCKEIAVRGAWRDSDTIIVYIFGQEQKVIFNGKYLIVQDGICEKCRAEKFPETVKP